MLLETRAIDIDQTDKISNTAVHYAAMRGHFKALRTLVRSGARLTLRNDINDYPFHDLISQNADAELFKLLMIETDKQLHAAHSDGSKFKLSWNTPGRAGMTPLMMAIMRKNKPIFDLLLAYDVSLAEQDAKGNTALHYAVIKRDKESAIKLIQNRNFNEHIFDIRNTQLESPLLIAVK